jgi:glycosyltransferase involved in cell wall biosynthesis
MSLSIVIPCYNECQNLQLLVESVVKVVKDRTDIQIILVDNGSIDNSYDLMRSLTAGFNFFKVIRVEINQGYGFGILQGLAASDGDVLAWTHADLQTDPADVLKAYGLYLEPSSSKVIVKGCRKNRRLAEAFFTYGMQVIASLALRETLSDVNAQPKLFSREFYNNHLIESAPNDFSLDLFLLYQARKHDFLIKELPVFFENRRYGEAKGGGSLCTRLKLIRRTFSYIFQLRKSLSEKGM